MKMNSTESSRRSSREFECYWGCISRETEVLLLTASEDGSYLIRDCISDPNCCTLAVRYGEQICRYRVTCFEAFDITSLTTCVDQEGKPVPLKNPVVRPEGIALYTQRERMALNIYDQPC